jgi:hypothetical protein
MARVCGPARRCYEVAHGKSEREAASSAGKRLASGRQAGHSFEITDRGRPVALLTPLPAGGELDRLIASGQVQAASGDLLELGPPLEPEPGLQPPSQILEEMRAADR